MYKGGLSEVKGEALPGLMSAGDKPAVRNGAAERKESSLFDIKTFNFWKKAPSNGRQIRNGGDVYEQMKGLTKADQESFWLIGLNIAHEEIYCDCVAIGGSNSSAVDTALVFRRLLGVGASSFVCVHNHPGGDPSPSSNDIDLTKRLKATGKVTGIKLLDAIIIGESGYTSIMGHIL